MRLIDPLIDVVTLPARLTVAAAQTTLALGELVSPEGPIRRPDGYADRAMLVIGPGGWVERLAAALTDPNGVMNLLTTVAAAVDRDRPLGRALAPGGTVDRLLDADGPVFRLLAEGGTVDRLLAEDGPLERLLVAGGALDRITVQGGVLDRLLADDGLLDRLLTEDGFVEKLVAEGGTLDQLIALGETLERIQPRLGELTRLIPELHASVDALNRVVEPLSELANRIPGGRRRTAVEA
jgi:hypothetical protein